MEAKPKASTHGGARRGAGGKPGPDGKRVKVSFTLPQAILDYLETTDNRSVTIEGLIRKSTAFRQFVLNKSPE